MSHIFGGIEAGGTKFVCAIGSSPDHILAETRFPTTTPEQTLGRVKDFFKQQEYRGYQPTALGIASFGPLDLHPNSPTYGYITTTPKPGWSHIDLVGDLRSAFDIPIGFDTDVNAAALGEQRWGATKNLDTFIYLTIGTGIGGGGMVMGNLIHGMLHPEMGHMHIPHNLQEDPFQGTCPYHGDCWEGLACGPAIAQRWGQPAEHLPANHPAWELEAKYLALGLANLICSLSPQRIILGGGVMQRSSLFPLIRSRVQKNLNNYILTPEITQGIDEYILPPALGARAGILGAIALAEQSL